MMIYFAISPEIKLLYPAVASILQYHILQAAYLLYKTHQLSGNTSQYLHRLFCQDFHNKWPDLCPFNNVGFIFSLKRRRPARQEYYSSTGFFVQFSLPVLTILICNSRGGRESKLNICIPSNTIPSTVC